MRKFAVIDIGSNSVRLMFVADGKVLYKGLQTTRLGEGIAEKPILNAAAIERSARAVELFYEKAKNEGAEKIVAFATAAVRSAENGAQFTDRVKELCGLQVEVISGEEEAEIGILGALGYADGGVIDIGGASTEIVVKDKGAIIYKKSVNIGVVRLKDKCGREKKLLEQAAINAVKEFGEVPSNGVLHGIGGTATTLAAQVLRLQEYQSEKITGAKITAEQIQVLADKLLTMRIEEIAALPCMPKGRADVLTGGAVLLATLMKKLGIHTLIASDTDNLEGYAIKRGLMG
jgi:exopolyphosphatase/guanosine-5'-triphosphate,3'-diphosphate pyrophosphatase